MSHPGMARRRAVWYLDGMRFETIDGIGSPGLMSRPQVPPAEL